MATKNSIDSNIPIESTKGGTQATSLVAYSVVCGSTSGTGALQSVASVGNADEVLVSQGAGSLPVFSPIPTFFSPLASDPTSPAVGDVWYNTTSDLFKGAKIGAWTTVNSVNTARRTLGGAGTSTSALSFGGFTSAVSAATEKWDGTNWSSVNSLNTARSGVGGTGTTADALSVGGNGSQTTTERWDGTNWTAKTGLNTGTSDSATAGSASDALTFGNVSGPTAHTERYSGGGDSWTNKSNMNTARGALGGTDDAATALSIGGYTGSVSAVTERYDGGGDSWTSKGSLNTARAYVAASASGSSSNALSYGGGTGAGGSTELTVTELYDTVGNSWSTAPSLNAAVRGQGGSSTSETDALSFTGRNSGGNVSATESYSSSSIITFTVT